MKKIIYKSGLLTNKKIRLRGNKPKLEVTVEFINNQRNEKKSFTKIVYYAPSEGDNLHAIWGILYFLPW